MTRVLVLAGTTEATRLAHLLVEDGFDVVSSLAGLTTNPVPRPGRTRTGGFGGIAGLHDYLRREAIDALVDATHPFAARMPHHAAAAGAAAGIPVLRLLRPAWDHRPGDRWLSVPDLPEAATAIDRLSAQQVLLTVGRRDLAVFDGCRARFVVRSIEPPEHLPPRAVVVHDRGPFDLAAERDLLRAHQIDTVVAKNAGGAATRAKLDAARELELPVIMVQRPPQPAVPTVSTVDAAHAWVRQLHRGV